MNYGRYFRLNQALSKVEDGVAIYDYIDLPAYFGPSVDNPMSPKFPISVLLTTDSVCFRLHYSAFKIEKQKGKDSTEAKDDNPRYAYKEDDIDQKAFIGEGNKSLMSMAHMEEVILELPFTENNLNNLSNTIKGVYNTRFPQIVDKNKSTGGRYLEQLIRKRYPPQKEWERIEKECCKNKNVDIETLLYKNLRDIYDNGSSYSSLWLMDLYKGGRIELFTTQAIRDKETGEDKETDVVTGFLRKVLLDFMFDLKHSDVFQNSACYQKMFSGLMSEFYFSSLMHKCEYYYYRKLIEDKEDKSGNLALLDQNGKKRFLKLYVEELAKAEELWIQDIMNPKSDVYFEYEKQFGVKAELSHWWKEEARGIFRTHQSWFAKPEEEMRRICFTLKDKENNRHICNTDTLFEYLNEHENDNKEVDRIISFREKSRIAISKWFLKRYDFNDLVHLHLFAYSNLLYILISIVLLTYLLVFPTSITYLKELIEHLNSQTKANLSLGWWLKVLGIGICFALIICAKGRDIVKLFHKYYRPKSLYAARKRKVYKRVSFWIGIQLLAIFFFFAGIYISKWVAIIPFVLLILTIIRNLVPNLHLLYPRLVASIATAWLTLAASNDLYAAFFDAKLSPLVICGLLLVVFLFVLYEIDRLIPLEITINKILRSAELTIISYTISLIIGAFIINFTCERILERSDVMENFYNDYVINKTEKKIENETFTITSNLSEEEINKFNDYKKVANLDSLMVNGEYPIASRIEINGYTFFILRNFWIQFSFVAMFVGIFIQMIFEDKRITEL